MCLNCWICNCCKELFKNDEPIAQNSSTRPSESRQYVWNDNDHNIAVQRSSQYSNYNNVQQAAICNQPISNYERVLPTTVIVEKPEQTFHVPIKPRNEINNFVRPQINQRPTETVKIFNGHVANHQDPNKNKPSSSTSKQISVENHKKTHQVDVPKRNKSKEIKTRKPPMEKLSSYLIPPELKKVMWDNVTITEDSSDYEKELIEYRSNKIILTIDNYFKFFTNLLHIEELQKEKDLKYSNMENVTFKLIENNKGGNLYILDMIYKMGGKFCLTEGTQFRIEHTDYESWKFSGVIEKIFANEIHLKFYNDYENIDSYILNEHYNIFFIVDRLPYQLEHAALEYMKKFRLLNFFFPCPSSSSNREKNYNNFVWHNLAINDNVEQQQAIKNILNCTAYPNPYIIFGPPGTGKTMTIIEAVIQICERSDTSNILITGMSNSSCDNIAIRLLQYYNVINEKMILRFYAKSAMEGDKINNKLKKISNFDFVGDKFPTCNQIYNYRIIIVTMTTSGRLAQLGIKNDHFTHVFIDEAGSSRETTCIVPIGGIVTSFGCVKANIILAGDPKQLGPVIYSKYCKRLGFEISFLERLMNFDIYKKDVTGNYNQKYIVKLLKNYRSHPAILNVPNKLFYCNEVESVGSPLIINKRFKSEILPQPLFPIIFHSVGGRVENDRVTMSIYNSHEINTVMYYLERIFHNGVTGDLTQEDIGIISPYKTQVIKLSSACKQREWPNIDVGTVEQFQGKEKSIIIISTVRSLNDQLGFLVNPKRFNVAITRAQSLLIVIGNGNTLKNTSTWKNFICYCKENKSLRGVPVNL